MITIILLLCYVIVFVMSYYLLCYAIIICFVMLFVVFYVMLCYLLCYRGLTVCKRRYASRVRLVYIGNCIEVRARVILGYTGKRLKTRSFRGAYVGSDHDLVMMTMRLKLKRLKKQQNIRIKYDLFYRNLRMIALQTNFKHRSV